MALSTNTPRPVLEISGLTKHYGGVKALTDAQFSLAPGEHAAIVGDNGAGKSTFVRLITGAEQPNVRIQPPGIDNIVKPVKSG